MKIIRITDRVPTPRREPTPADLLRQLLAARAPRMTELRRRLRQPDPGNDESAPPAG